MVRITSESVAWICGHHTADSEQGAALLAAAALCTWRPFANSFPISWVKEAAAVHPARRGVRNAFHIFVAAAYALIFGAGSETGNAE